MEDSKVNPLYNPLVVKLIYEQLDFPDKKDFRLVCKTWIDTILGHWRKHTKLVIVNESNLNFCINSFTHNNALVDTFQHCNPMPNEDYFDLYKINEKPLLNLKLHSVGFSYLPVHLDQLKNKNIKEYFLTFQSLILERFAPSLEELQMFCCPFLQDQRQEAGLQKLLLNDFPNLKVLNITPEVKANPKTRRRKVSKNVFPKTHSDLTSFTLMGGGYSQRTATIILNLMPNLKKLQLIGGASDILGALKYPLYPSSGGKHLLLENLEVDTGGDLQLSGKIRPWLQEYIEAARPPIKTLKAAIIFGARGPLQPFLWKPIWSCLENTLTRLKLRVYVDWTSFTLLTGSSLPNLTHLHIRFWDNFPSGEQGHKFDFGMLKGTPQLKVLHLIHELTSQDETIVEERDLVWNPSGEQALTGMLLEYLEDFRFELKQELSESSWRALACFMPNLFKIRATLNETTFPLVLQLWPGLKHCSMSGNRIPQELIAEMRAKNEKVQIEVGEYRENRLKWEQW